MGYIINYFASLQMNYARFYYSELFPDLHGKVLHIDDDCIIQGKDVMQ